jgi:hypothetical protein
MAYRGPPGPYKCKGLKVLFSFPLVLSSAALDAGMPKPMDNTKMITSLPEKIFIEISPYTGMMPAGIDSPLHWAMPEMELSPFSSYRFWAALSLYPFFISAAEGDGRKG